MLMLISKDYLCRVLAVLQIDIVTEGRYIGVLRNPALWGIELIVSMETGHNSTAAVCVVGCWTKTGPRSWSASSSSRTLPCRPHHHLHPAVQPKPKSKIE
jgi:hypothetical protein